jgi:hypothetical protein
MIQQTAAETCTSPYLTMGVLTTIIQEGAEFLDEHEEFGKGINEN